MSGPCPVFAATAAFGRMSSCHSLSTRTSTPVAFANASMFARVAASSASRNLLQRKSRRRAFGSGLKGCSCAQAAAHSSPLGAAAAPAASAPVLRMWRRVGKWRLPGMGLPPLFWPRVKPAAAAASVFDAWMMSPPQGRRQMAFPVERPRSGGTRLLCGYPARSRAGGSSSGPQPDWRECGNTCGKSRNEPVNVANVHLKQSASAAAEHALALGDGEGRGLVAARMGLGADEAVLLRGPFGRLLLDDAAGLVAAGRGIGGGADAVALVLDGIEARFLGRRAGAAAREAGPQGPQDRDHRGAPLSKA